MFTEPQFQLLTPEQVADRVGISVRSVRERVYRGSWPHLRIDARTVRFTEEQLQEIVETSARSGHAVSIQRPATDAGRELAALLNGRR